MRKLLGLALLIVALPACATARSIGAAPADALDDLGQAFSGVVTRSPQATVKPVASAPVTPAPAPEVGDDASLLERRPNAEPASVSAATTLGDTHPATGISSSRLETHGVGLHWSVAPDVLLGPAVEWCTEGALVVDERLSFGLTLRF